jgi:CheY-like chemotaxis protein
MKTRGKILWVDDEIEHLKPHILFLEEKGFEIETASNGADGIKLTKNRNIDLALLDQYMPGMDGMDTLRELKKIDSALPVIMVTRSEEESLMNEAISEKVTQFLIKPVNPSQVFMAIKQVLESGQIREEKTTRDFLKEYQDISTQKKETFSVEEWWDLYQQLVHWQLELDNHNEPGLQSILEEEIQSSNHEFSRFVLKSYSDWVKSESRPPMSVDVVERFVLPELESGKKACFLVLDCLRHDQLMALVPLLSSIFQVDIQFHVSILPTATPYSRNALFSGMYFDELLKKYPDQLTAMNSGVGLNQFEETYLRHLLDKNDLSQIGMHYHKIWSAEHGIKFQHRIGDYLNIDLLAIVVNFVDQLAHKQSESSVLKEMVSDESAFCRAVVSWFKNSWLLDVLKYLGENGYRIILTSDHGSICVHKGVMVKADKDTSTGVRYKVGRNLNCDEKFSVKVHKPSDYKLPEMGHQSTYLFARDSAFFLYPNQMKKYQNTFKNSFQHGGISMEEMLIPVAVLEKR